MPFVKLRTWDDMEAEFGLDKDGDINCPWNFTLNMEEKLPYDRIIEVIGPNSEGDYKWLRSYTIHPSMIEYFIPEKGDSIYGIAKPLGQHSV